MQEVKGRIISLETRCLSSNRGISSLEKDHTHGNDIITLVQACKWVLVCILSLAIIYLTVFMPSKYITLKFDCLNNIDSSGNGKKP